MGDARKCTATSKRTGKRCRQAVFKRADGTYTTTCRSHSGRHQLREPGDAHNGGRPPTSYAEVGLVPKAWRAYHASARAAAGRLEEELALLRTNHARFLTDPKTEQMGSIERGRISGEHAERIARVEQRRAIVLKTLQELDDPPPPMGTLRLVTGDDPEDHGPTDESRQHLREKLLRDE